MGVYIKGMEMPEKCEKCDLCFLIKGEHFCQFLYEPVNFEIESGKRSEYCPLVPVPPHGRLIDADALDASLKEMSEIEWNQKAFPVSWAYAFEAFRGIIERDEPTIIEAEEEGE